MSRVGEIKKNKYGTEMKVVVYNSCLDIWVEFQDEHKVRVHTTYTNFKNGNVKNPYDKTIVNVGYIGVGKYTVAKNKEPNWKVRYSAWRSMIARCHNPEDSNFDKYIDCEVCEEWHNYQNFAEWYDENIYYVGTERMHVDKDILHEGNKIYSPENCIIVPQSINEIFHTSLGKKTKDVDLPYTIRRVSNNRYSVAYRAKSLGVYDTVEDCVDAYMNAKREHIRNKVNELKDELPKHIQEILLNW